MLRPGGITISVPSRSRSCGLSEIGVRRRSTTYVAVSTGGGPPDSEPSTGVAVVRARSGPRARRRLGPDDGIAPPCALPVTVFVEPSPSTVRTAV